MAKLRSVPLYPTTLVMNNPGANLILNMTHEGQFQIARVLRPGGPQEGDFEVLYKVTTSISRRNHGLFDSRKRYQILTNVDGRIPLSLVSSCRWETYQSS
jgi:hypothetical protein